MDKNKSYFITAVATAAAVVLVAAAAAVVLQGLSGYAQKPSHPIGYQDTPMLPGGKWHVHDGNRPQPPVITPGTCSTPDAPGKPPSDAIVLFDGKDLSKWRSAKGVEPTWKVENGYMQVQGGGGGIETKDEFGDCQLHVEWAAPTPPKGDSQGRGNSGVFFFGREGYELQVLDSFQNPTYPDGQAAAIYGQYPPLVNAARKPGEWQVYDVVFTAPRFSDGKLETPAYITVFHNGIVVHNHTALLGRTGHKVMPKYTPHGPKGPIHLQDHGNPVRYRNIWIRPLKGYDEP